MRKQGDYIKEPRLKFRKGMQTRFIKLIKESSNKTWPEIAEKIGVHRLTICSDWYSERTTIPKRLVYELTELGNLNKNEINLSSESLEIEYILYIKGLIKKLFDLDCYIFSNKKHPNNTLMDSYSRDLVRFLEKNG